MTLVHSVLRIDTKGYLLILPLVFNTVIEIIDNPKKFYEKSE